MEKTSTNSTKRKWWDNMSPEEQDARKAALLAGQQRRREYINTLIETAEALKPTPKKRAVDSNMKKE